MFPSDPNKTCLGYFSCVRPTFVTCPHWNIRFDAWEDDLWNVVIPEINFVVEICCCLSSCNWQDKSMWMSSRLVQNHAVETIWDISLSEAPSISSTNNLLFLGCSTCWRWRQPLALPWRAKIVRTFKILLHATQTRSLRSRREGRSLSRTIRNHTVKTKHVLGDGGKNARDAAQ